MRVKLAFSTLAAAFLVASLASCEKKTDCKLVIKTVDVAGMPLGNTAVRLYANVKTASGSTVEADLKAEGISDAAGVSSYTFKLPAILDVKATATGSLVGVGIVKLEEGKTVEKTITVK